MQHSVSVKQYFCGVQDAGAFNFRRLVTPGYYRQHCATALGVLSMLPVLQRLGDVYGFLLQIIF